MVIMALQSNKSFFSNVPCQCGTKSRWNPCCRDTFYKVSALFSYKYIGSLRLPKIGGAWNCTQPQVRGGAHALHVPPHCEGVLLACQVLDDIG
jgi:hypothetical protein